jgi:chromate reductase
MNILGISGSLRAKGINTVAIRDAVPPPGVTFAVYRELGDLPQFNPDLDNDSVSLPVIRLRELFRVADAILICTPEYARGVPGSLKNALDWLVSSGELLNKPVALVNLSSRATHATASLTETLEIMSARVTHHDSVAQAFAALARPTSAPAANRAQA